VTGQTGMVPDQANFPTQNRNFLFVQLSGVVAPVSWGVSTWVCGKRLPPLQLLIRPEDHTGKGKGWSGMGRGEDGGFFFAKNAQKALTAGTSEPYLVVHAFQDHCILWLATR
jgi:hypothetical protein